MIILLGILVIGIGALLLNKAMKYSKEVNNSLNDEEVLNRGDKHWEMVEISRSSTWMFIYAIGIMLSGLAIIVLYGF